MIMHPYMVKCTCRHLGACGFIPLGDLNYLRFLGISMQTMLFVRFNLIGLIQFKVNNLHSSVCTQDMEGVTSKKLKSHFFFVICTCFILLVISFYMVFSKLLANGEKEI